MKRLEVSGAVRPIYGSLGVKRLKNLAVSHSVQRNLYRYRQSALDRTELLWFVYRRLLIIFLEFIQFSGFFIFIYFGSRRSLCLSE